MRTVQDNALAAFDLAARLDGRSGEVWLNDGYGRNTLKPVKLRFRWQTDRMLMDSEATFTCEALMICKAAELPRRPLAGELLHYPRNTVWQVADSYESQAIYFIGLNRAGSTSQ